jgi:hypothetical protein
MEYVKSVANFAFGDGHISCIGCAIAPFLVFISLHKYYAPTLEEVKIKSKTQNAGLVINIIINL